MRILGKLFRSQRTPSATLTQRHTVVLTAHCVQEITQGMASNVKHRHEGIAYFIGLKKGTTTLAASARFPDAATTRGSFDVSSEEMGKITGEAAEPNLQVVGQIHTYPVDAFHSKGDLKGMPIKHPGYFSLVLPKYGTLLPSLQDSHTLMWDGNNVGRKRIPRSRRAGQNPVKVKANARTRIQRAVGRPHSALSRIDTLADGVNGSYHSRPSIR